MAVHRVLYAGQVSSASARVRIALKIKRLEFQEITIGLAEGEQHRPAYLQLQPQKLVPVLVDKNGTYIQSLAIIEYLDECYPLPRLLPKTLSERAWVRAFAQIFCADTHPLLTRRVFSLLNQMSMGEEEIQQWRMHWLRESFVAAEEMLSQRSQSMTYCQGDQPGLADIFLIPQCDAAHRMGFSLELYPNIWRIYTHCKQLEEFKMDRSKE
ncbi:maleylacetoacetate isomerase [Serratia plymuthica]|uniref:maleylacetoacetate isomerase n=1 Tax=Serratia plymuthica TaxID=82996 RepID=UPI003BA2026A